MTRLIFVILYSLSLIGHNGYSQAKKKVNRDSINWEKENTNWEKYIFTQKEFVNKIQISKKDSVMSLYSSMQKECRIFGYNKPNKNSKKMILLSIWTFDVKGNPSNCKYGSYYDTSSMDDMELKYIGKDNSFIKAALMKNAIKVSTIYFENKWVEFVID
ncbi:hypothetical protein FNW52_08925 [Flavobacterium sp. ZT3R18]|uniref:hypothetical protein n=1 Tax=Flavobacterium sp. ZT3R18 TaxID=2594429 RepID=UPI00117A20B0|nr:hypothetical protein [Flavobacterium sp. ZT3R18]TRX36138.1 hypothetical protein FNW52_08925 [Flavobacterium sp. ZT3R18]